MAEDDGVTGVASLLGDEVSQGGAAPRQRLAVGSYLWEASG